MATPKADKRLKTKFGYSIVRSSSGSDDVYYKLMCGKEFIEQHENLEYIEWEFIKRYMKVRIERDWARRLKPRAAPRTKAVGGRPSSAGPVHTKPPKTIWDNISEEGAARVRALWKSYPN
jgi:hypothetical protein